MKHLRCDYHTEAKYVYNCILRVLNMRTYNMRMGFCTVQALFNAEFCFYALLLGTRVIQYYFIAW